MKEYNELESLKETLKIVSSIAEKNSKSLESLKDVFKKGNQQALEKLKTKEEKEKYNEFIKMADKLISDSSGKTFNEIQKDIEKLKNYGK